MATQTLSPQRYARTAGLVYLIEIALAFAVNPVWSKLFDARGVAVTATRVAAPFSPWRLAFAGEVLTYVCYAAIAALFYALFRPVNPMLALLSAFLMLAHAAIGAASSLGRLAAVLLLGGSGHLAAIDARDAHALVSLALDLHGYGHDVGLVFFAFHCALLGYLIYRSGYLPKVFGALFVLASVCLSISVTTDLLDPAINAAIFPAIVLPLFLTQLFFALWLAIMGVNIRKWPSGAGYGAAALS
jgi:Domain of unknown function (DUF4386)